MARSKGKSSGASNEVSPKTALGCLLLFAIPFVMGGLALVLAGVDDVQEHLRIQKWVETPATILETELDTEPGEDGGVMYQVRAKYVYAFAGKRYESTRAVVNEGFDSVGNFHRKKAKLLKAARDEGRTVSCYVNPNDPADAVLFRELRYGMLAMFVLGGLVFGGAGVGLASVGVYSYRKETRRTTVAASHPQEPWNVRRDWARGKIRSSRGIVEWFLTAFAVIWNSFSWPMYFTLREREAEGEDVKLWLFGLFPTLGTIVGVCALYVWFRRLWWGRSTLELGSVPGVVGGKLIGVIHVPRKIKADPGVTLRLSCIEQKSQQTGGSTRSWEEDRWSTERVETSDLARGAWGRTIIPVEIEIPFDALQSSERIVWRLEASAATRGIDYFVTFDVPIYRTAGSRRKENGNDDASAESKRSAKRETQDLGVLAARMGAVVERDAVTGRRLLFSGMRNKNAVVNSMIFTLLWTTASAICFYLTAPGFLSWTLAALAALTGLMFLIYVFARTRLEFGPAGVSTDVRLFGLGWRTMLLPGEIKAVDVKKSGSVVGSTVFREVYAKTAEDEEKMLVSEIARLEDAQELAATVWQSVREAMTMAREKSSDGQPPMVLDAGLPEELQ